MLHKIFLNEITPMVHTSFDTELNSLSEKIFWEGGQVPPKKNFRWERGVLTTKNLYPPEIIKKNYFLNFPYKYVYYDRAVYYNMF